MGEGQKEVWQNYRTKYFYGNKYFNLYFLFFYEKSHLRTGSRKIKFYILRWMMESRFFYSLIEVGGGWCLFKTTVFHRLEATQLVFRIKAAQPIFGVFTFICVEKSSLIKVRTVFGEKKVAKKSSRININYFDRFIVTEDQ